MRQEAETSTSRDAPVCVPIADAIQRIALKPPSDLAHVRRADLTRELTAISDACMFGLAEPCASGAVAALRRRLVDVIRHEVITGWESDHTPDQGTMLDALVRLEFAHRACEAAPDQNLSAEFTGSGGVNLVTEVAHDMRSPLTSIVFLSEVLHKEHSGPLTPLQRRQLGIVYSAALGLVGLASDLIEMSRGDRRRSNTQPQPFAVNGVLRSVHDLVRPMVEEKNLTFTIDPLATDRRMGFPIELSRILLNLTTNALKYTTEGGVTVSATPVAGNLVEFAVTDTGPGVPEDMVIDLFQPLRYEPRRESGYAFSGSGLGLAICQRLVRWMGAELAIDTSPAGTRFSFQLELPPASSV